MKYFGITYNLPVFFGRIFKAYLIKLQSQAFTISKAMQPIQPHCQVMLKHTIMCFQPQLICIYISQVTVEFKTLGWCLFISEYSKAIPITKNRRLFLHQKGKVVFVFPINTFKVENRCFYVLIVDCLLLGSQKNPAEKAALKTTFIASE